MANVAPVMVSVLVNNTIKKLSTLLNAVDPTIPTRLGQLNIELDSAALGNLFIGNSAVAANNCGRHLTPGGGHTFFPGDQGLVRTDDVFLLSDQAGNQQVNIIATPKGM